MELGFLQYLQRDWAGARKTLAPLALSGGEVRPRAARILLATDRDSEDYADGLTQARAFAAADPSEPEWPAAVAEFEYRTGGKKAAETKLDALGASGNLDSMLAAADVYARLKRFDAAAKIARAATVKYPESTEAQFRLGSSLERAGTTAEAEAVFLKLLEERPNDAATQNYLGYMWADNGVELEKAKELLERAVAREPRNPAYLDSLGWVYFRMGSLDIAEKNLREAARREPTDPTIVEHLGRPRDETGRHRGRDPALGEGPRAEVRGGRSRPGEAATRPSARLEALTPRRSASLLLLVLPVSLAACATRTAATRHFAPGDRSPERRGARGRRLRAGTGGVPSGGATSVRRANSRGKGARGSRYARGHV